MEILELKSITVTEIKIHQRVSPVDLNWQKRELLDMKIDKQRLWKPKNWERKWRKKNEQALREVSDIIKHTSTHIMGLPKEEEREQEEILLKRTDS